jgi:hypothetical protein
MEVGGGRWAVGGGSLGDARKMEPHAPQTIWWIHPCRRERAGNSILSERRPFRASLPSPTEAKHENIINNIFTQLIARLSRAAIPSPTLYIPSLSPATLFRSPLHTSHHRDRHCLPSRPPNPNRNSSHPRDTTPSTICLSNLPPFLPFGPLLHRSWERRLQHVSSGPSSKRFRGHKRRMRQWQRAEGDAMRPYHGMRGAWLTDV